MSGYLVKIAGWLALAAAVVLCGCAGGYANGVYRGKEAAFRVGPLNDSWRQLAIEDNDVAFTSTTGRGSISANATCGKEYEDAPLIVLANHLLFGATRRQAVLEETVTLAGREGRHAIVNLELDGVPMTAELFVVKRERCIYDLEYVAAPASFAAGQADFHRFVDGFKALNPDE